MPQAHSLLPAQPQPRPRRILITGAAGRIGRFFAEQAPDYYSIARMVRPGESLEGEFIEAELSDLPRLKEVCQGVDTVLHLAAETNPRTTWEPLLESNITGTYNLFVAAKAAGCRRVVFASSIHAVSGHPPDTQIRPEAPVAPGDLYGVSKCFGEALGRYMAEMEGLSSIVVRIGACLPPESVQDPNYLDSADAWISYRDLTQLFVRCIDDESLKFAIVNGLSGSRFNRLDITSARELLGYVPQDDFARENPAFADHHGKVASHSLRDGYVSGLRDDL